MNFLSTALLALTCASTASLPMASAPPPLVALDSIDDLKAEIEAAAKARSLNEAKSLEFGKRALELAKSAPDAAGRTTAAGMGLALMRSAKAGSDGEKLRSEFWDLVIEKDLDNGALFAPLVTSHLKDAERAATLRKKSKAQEVKAACALVELQPLLSSRDRSEKETKELVAGLNSIKKEFGQVVDPSTRKPWSEVCDDKLFPIERLAIGAEVPEIEGADTSGVNFKLSDYRGKVVLLDFWGNW